MTATTAVDADEARRLRDAMTDKLVKLGMDHVCGRSRPRSGRSPGTRSRGPALRWRSATTGTIVRNKKDADGVTLSSISAAWLQARMIAQARIGPGARVLEIGTTGYNAAVIAEVAGPGGHVVTVDIDPEVVRLGRSRLAGRRLRRPGHRRDRRRRGRRAGPRPVRRHHRDSRRLGHPAFLARPARRRRHARRPAADERRHPLHRLPQGRRPAGQHVRCRPAASSPCRASARSRRRSSRSPRRRRPHHAPLRGRRARPSATAR